MPDRENRIRRRAHEIWEREGRPHGRDAEHWRQAEREIDGEASAGATDAALLAWLARRDRGISFGEPSREPAERVWEETDDAAGCRLGALEACFAALAAE